MLVHKWASDADCMQQSLKRSANVVQARCFEDQTKHISSLLGAAQLSAVSGVRLVDPVSIAKVCNQQIRTMQALQDVIGVQVLVHQMLGMHPAHC